MKQIAVVANQRKYAEELRVNLLDYFEGLVRINTYTMEDLASIDFLEEDLVGVTYTILQDVKPKVKSTSALTAFNLMMTKNNVEKLKGLPGNTRALLVNLDQRSCLQMIANIYALGYRDIELIPYYGEGDYDRSIRLAITPDEERLVPSGIERVINVGHREIDMNCILDIADRLGVKDVLRSSDRFARKKDTLFGSSSVEKILGENEDLSDQIGMLIQLMEQGILITDNMGRIYLFNEKAEALLRGRQELSKGLLAAEILPEIDLGDPDFFEEGRKELLISDGAQNLIVSIVPIRARKGLGGHIISVKNFEEVEEHQHGVRARLSRRSHIAKYDFSDIKGGSRAIAEAAAAARRMAGSDSSILITGESGTGKEVFAQSIHNASARRRYNFVAVNCAAIPENLLESEMFGYEEGSFTGARRGGKIGYFELAHKGTIFLDEIGEMPLRLQAKLLRAIEERKIIKIGSQKVIDVDVRIIAATNKDLYRMAREGVFREDLYYRLNVLPLSIPPLRERKGDIMLLICHFMELHRRRLIFSPEAQGILEAYEWRGNIRELRNVVEYLTNLEKREIGKEDLPSALLQSGGEPEVHTERRAAPGGGDGPAAAVEYGLLSRLLLRESNRLEIYLFVLEELEKAALCGRRTGRPGLAAAAREQKRFFTEPEIRAALNRLNDCGFVRSGKGRGGSVITEKGMLLKEEIKKANW